MNSRIAMNAQKEITPTFRAARNPLLQRTCACGGTPGVDGDCAECRQKRLSLQRRAANQAGSSAMPSIVGDVLHSSGQALDSAARAFMEPRFGHDFSQVRVHTDARAAESAKAVNALAYTVGRDMVFGTGQYSPKAGEGQRLLAHELTHVLQQRSSSSDIQQGLSIDSPGSRYDLEADRIADSIVHGVSPSHEFMHISPTIQRMPVDIFDQPQVRSPKKIKPGEPLPYREATELHDCMQALNDLELCQRHLGIDAGFSNAKAGKTTEQPKLTIQRQGGEANTFLSTDTISFTAEITGTPNASTLLGQINWTVHGVSSHSGEGNPHVAEHQSRFSFRPNPTQRPTSGSRVPNDPIQYRVEAQASGVSVVSSLEQDEKDIIRQEYVDLHASPPSRDKVVTPSDSTFNVGNYSLIIDEGMETALTTTKTEFERLTQQTALSAPGGGITPGAAVPAPVAVPAITVTSGYRNPRRNIAAGSKFPVTSRHVWGRALDLSVAGANATLWERLRQAGGAAASVSICERGPTQIKCDGSEGRVDHVHIQW